MVTRAWFGERFWTSTIRGLRNPDWGMCGPVCLLRVQLDDEAFVDRGGQVGAAGHGLEGALQPLRIDLQPLGDATRLRRLGGGLDAQLLAVVGEPRATLLAVLARGVGAALDGAFVGEALLALQEQLLAFPAALAALGVEDSCHAVSWLDAPALRRTATVVRNRGHVRDAGNLQPDRIERPHRRFAPGAGALDADLDVLHAAFLRRSPGALGGDLRGERRRLARALEPGVPRGRPGKSVALPVGDGHDGVVERRVHVRDALGDVFLDLFARARRRRLLKLLPRRCVPARHEFS